VNRRVPDSRGIFCAESVFFVVLGNVLSLIRRVGHGFPELAKGGCERFTTSLLLSPFTRQVTPHGLFQLWPS
jgi:hypothetical protein